MMSIGEAARQSGVTVETIRYYERAGIVPKPHRADNGRRVYSGEAISRLRFIRRCRDLGFSIPDAKALAALADGAVPDCQSAAGIGSKHIAAIRRRITELYELENALVELVGNCRGGQLSCPMLDTLANGPAVR